MHAAAHVWVGGAGVGVGAGGAGLFTGVGATSGCLRLQPPRATRATIESERTREARCMVSPTTVAGEIRWSTARVGATMQEDAHPRSASTVATSPTPSR